MIRLKCEECDRIHEFEDEELNYEDVQQEERQMGTEVEYEGELEFTCDCNNEIKVTFRFWEYPPAAFNNSDHEESGCKIIEEPNYRDYIN